MPRAGAQAWIRGLDPPIYIVGAVPILVGAASTLHTSTPLPFLFWPLVLAAFLCIHAAVNVFNDAFDAATPADRAKRHSLARLASVNSLYVLATLLLLAGCAVGIVLWLRVGGWQIFVLSAAGVALNFLYHAPPFRLSHRTWGEPVTFLGFGPIPVWTAAALASGTVPTRAIVPGLLCGLAAVLVLYFHHFNQQEGDASGGKRTPVVLLGRKRAAWVGLALSFLTILGAAATSGRLLHAAVTVAVLVPLAWLLHRQALRGQVTRPVLLGLYAGLGLSIVMPLLA